LLFNIDLHKLVKGRKTNMWAYDENTRALTNHEHPNMAIFAGKNKNVVIYKSKGMKYQIFNYNEAQKAWSNQFTNHAI